MFRILLREELRSFIESAHQFIGVRFPQAYLEQNRVIGFYRGEVLMGGFAIVTDGYRSLEGIPGGPAGNIPPELLRLIDESQVFEINALWLDPSVRGYGRARFWFQLYLEIIRTKRPYFIYSYPVKKPKVGCLYRVAKPKTLFTGETRVLPGMTHPEVEIVEMGSTWALHESWIRQPFFLVSKLLKTRRRSYRPAEAIHAKV